MIKNCVICEQKNTSHLAFCEDCKSRVWELEKHLSSEQLDTLGSDELTEAALAIYDGYNIEDEDFDYGYIVDYLLLVAIGLKSEEDLRGFLVEEAKLKPDKAEILAHELCLCLQTMLKRL